MGISFDVIVIGGGPAGMMAAGRAAETGARVALVEKNARPGKKLLLTGNGRCNLTNAGLDKSNMVEKFGPNGKFFYSAFAAFGVSETIQFFHGRGLSTKVEDAGRVFPASGRAQDVLDALLGYLRAGGVAMIQGSPVLGLGREGGKITGVMLGSRTLAAEKYILATGGRSFPRTGSIGDAYAWLREMGHTIIEPLPALSPINVRERWIAGAEGASLTDAMLTIRASGMSVIKRRGECVITRDGISGPVALDLSATVAEALHAGAGEVRIVLDLMPEITRDALDRQMVKQFEAAPNRLVKNTLEEFVTPRLVPLVLSLAGLDGELRVNRVGREARLRLSGVVKGIALTARSVAGFDRAMVTRGGVSLKEVDSKTMRSKLYENLYLAGEVLDLDGPTGGYNLQVCWSTGRVGGERAAK